MASPDNTTTSKLAPKSPVVQESPFSSYVSNLSPLKVVESRVSTQPYAVTSCPFPEPVFTSPQFNRPRELSLLKRLTGGGRFPPRNNSAATMIPENTVITSMEQMVNSRHMKCTTSAPLDQSYTSPPTSVDAYLAYPPENCEDPSGEPKHRLVQAAEQTPDAQGDFVSCMDDQSNGHEDAVLGALAFTSDGKMVEHSTSTGLPDLNSDQATTFEETIERTSVSNVRPHTNKVATICTSSSSLAEREAAGSEPSDPVHTVETADKFKILDKAVRSLHTQLKPAFEDANVGVGSFVMPASSVHVAWSTDCMGTSNATGHSFVMSKDNEACHRKEVLNNSGFWRQGLKDGTLQWDALTSNPQRKVEFLHNIQEGDNSFDALEATSNTSFENYYAFDQEGDLQSQRAMRKRLQFESVEHHKVNSGFSCDVDNSVRNIGSCIATVPRTLGIGLHLNSLGGPININMNVQSPENCKSIQEEDVLSGRNDQEQDSRKIYGAVSSIAGLQSVQLPTSSDNFSPQSALQNNEERQLEYQATDAPYQSSFAVKPLSRTVQLKCIDRLTPCSTIKRPSEDANKTDSTQSPRIKKTKTDSEGCKRCNCKRSKCLKLYCDCFAAGIFCSDACACQACHNKPEHENTVLETRQLIVSRNPLAFAPKVVVRSTDAPKVSGESEGVTPVSARHKRGCNCKKSLCLKKYCECFQAGVGCSMGCRCEGCRNTFGRKDSDEVIEYPENNELGSERALCENQESREVKKQIISIEHCSSRLTPATPHFQGNDALKSQLPARYHPSPESGVSLSPSYESPNSPMDSLSSSMFAKETEGTLSLVPYNPESRCLPAGQVDSFSPGWDRFIDICNFSPLTNPSPQGRSPAGAPKLRESPTLQTKLISGSGRLSIGSHGWRNSPITPLPQFGEGKFVIEPYSDSGMRTNNEDDTPEILKDTCSPIMAVKATSPNQKRVSPPHKHLNEMTPSSSSPATKSSRKFILQSVPSFPPLTPYSNKTKRDDT